MDGRALGRHAADFFNEPKGLLVKDIVESNKRLIRQTAPAVSHILQVGDPGGESPGKSLWVARREDSMSQGWGPSVRR